MPRLIEVQDPRACPRLLMLRVGDVLACSASGGRVRGDGRVVEMLGAFVPAALAPDGGVLAPAGAPGTVMFAARAAGSSAIDVVTGDPWGARVTTSIDVRVEC